MLKVTLLALIPLLVLSSSLLFASTTYIPTGRMFTELTDPQLRHACIQERLILAGGSHEKQTSV